MLLLSSQVKLTDYVRVLRKEHTTVTASFLHVIQPTQFVQYKNDCRL